MDLTEQQVLSAFQSGINCSMVVFGEAASALGLSEKEARKIASGFGGGMGHGSICGCVTGALMALGLKYGSDGLGDSEQMKLFKQKRQEFETEFMSRFGSLFCPEILGGRDPSVPDQKAIIAAKGLTKDVCAQAVCAACEILTEMFENDE